MSESGVIAPVIWKRHDLPGHETCRILALDTGWQVTGVTVLVYEGHACRLDYVIDCDLQWLTRSAMVTGWVGDRAIDVAVRRDVNGQWRLNRQTGGGGRVHRHRLELQSLNEPAADPAARAGGRRSGVGAGRLVPVSELRA